MKVALPTKPAPPAPRFAGMPKRLPAPAAKLAVDPTTAWADVLSAAGLPTDVVVIDFETYFDDEYHMGRAESAKSTVEYIADSRFEVVCCSFLLMNPKSAADAYLSDTFCQVGEDMVETQIKCLQKRYGDNFERCTFVAQNAAFDGMVLAMKYGIVPAHTVDVLGLARAWNSRANNDLDAQCKRWGLPPKGDTAEFSGVTRRVRFKKPKTRKKGPKLPIQMPMMTPEQQTAIVGYANNDVMREWELLTILLPRLSRPQVELQVMQLTLEMFWKPTMTVNVAKADEIVAAMDAEITRVISEAGVVDTDEKTAREQISGDKTFEALLLDALKVAGDNAQQYYKPCKRGYMLALAKDDDARKTLCSHPSETVKNLMAARGALDSWPLHINRVKRIVRQWRARGNKLSVPLKYHGAHTGRDSGGEKINLQNLGSRGHALVNAVREIITAIEGQALVITDAAAVEARGLAWIAGETDLCAKFAAGAEIYCDFASRVLGYPVRKPKKDGIPAIEKKMKWARNSIGKVGILGCGYGMGRDRIFDYAQGSITMETAEKIKVEYRAAYPAIVQFWRDIEQAFIYTAKYKRPCEMARGLRFHSLPDCDVVLTLPSGRELHYHTVKLVPGKFSEGIEVYNEQEHKWMHHWGGHLTENVVQAFCRDFLMEASIRLKSLGVHTALRVHDELVMPVPAEDAQRVLKLSEHEMSRRPAWALDCPLGAEGLVSVSYKKG